MGAKLAVFAARFFMVRGRRRRHLTMKNLLRAVIDSSERHHFKSDPSTPRTRAWVIWRPAVEAAERAADFMIASPTV